jgi:hypothetical protein
VDGEFDVNSSNNARELRTPVRDALVNINVRHAVWVGLYRCNDEDGEMIVVVGVVAVDAMK